MPVDTRRQNERLGGVSHHRATEVSRQDLQNCARIPTFRGFCVFRGKKRLEAGGGTAASPSTQGREAAAPPAHANQGSVVLPRKTQKRLSPLCSLRSLRLKAYAAEGDKKGPPPQRGAMFVVAP